MNGRSSPRRARHQAARPSVSPFYFAASLRSAEPLCAAEAPDFSDFTMKAGASSEAVNVWPPKWKSFVRHSSIVPRVRPCGVTYDTRSPTFDDLTLDALLPFDGPYRARHAEYPRHRYGAAVTPGERRRREPARVTKNTAA